MSRQERWEDLADRLDGIAEEIAELAIDELRAAIREGRRDRPAEERTLSQARRAVDKASHLLRRGPAGSAGASDDD